MKDAKLIVQLPRGSAVEPLIVAVEAAEQPREEELAVLLDAARRSSCAGIVRIVRDA